MTEHMRRHLTGLSAAQRKSLERESKKALRSAWMHRHVSFRAPGVVRANVTMLRNLRTI